MKNQNLGKRKCAIANVEFVSGTGVMKINNLTEETYFQKQYSLISIIWSPLKKFSIEKKFDILIQVNGGGKSAQAAAIQLGIARAINKKLFQQTNQINAKKGRSLLKKENYLTRDPRIKERRKYGLKKARKSSQFSKR